MGGSVEGKGRGETNIIHFEVHRKSSGEIVIVVKDRLVELERIRLKNDELTDFSKLQDREILFK